MSTKFCVNVTPHSRPARTSATSSLKRRSEAIVALVDDDVVAGDARLERLADDAFGDEQTGRLAVLAGREDLADFGAADDRLERFRPELARHAGADLVGQVVDHVVIFQRDLLRARRSRAPWRWRGR